jgi:peptidoglycan hydrolase-like protein with peptidoglycan-binding domain
MISDSLQEGSSGDEVRKLQQILKDLNLLKIEPSGYFGPLTTHAVFKFQQRVGLVTSIEDQTAGFVGPATRNELNKYINNKSKIASNIRASVDLTSVESSISMVSEFQFASDLNIGSVGPEVEELQSFLKKKGYFMGNLITDYFGPVTKNALIKFKSDNGLEVNSDVLFDTDTRTFINQLI